MDERIIIGIDFGTTYSGVAWAYSKEPEEIEVVTTWESDLNRCSDLEKVPTKLHYGEEEDDQDDIKWGYTVPENGEALQWFKLLLLKHEDLPSEVRHSSQLEAARRLQEASWKGPVEIVACFLQRLWRHALQSIEEAVGKNLLDDCRFHIVVTLPAIWPHYAQELMREAVRDAGILDMRSCGETVLQFISEPEAAALATIKDHAKKSTIKVGDNIVVCDAGGGTVDLISYKVDSKDPFVLKECVKGDGGLCGGIFVDEEFEKLITDKVTSSWKSLEEEQVKKFLNDNWEHGIKPQFRGQNRSWAVELPSSVVARGQCNKRSRTLEISTSELVDVFDPVVKRIESLVQRQSMSIFGKYGEEPKFVVLVGGFGRSPYLYERLKKLVTSETTVLQLRGSKPWVAICRGAVIHAITSLGLSKSLDVKVETRVARMSYGIKISESFDLKIHDFSDGYINQNTLKPMAKNQMRWFMQQGHDLSATSSVRHAFVRTFKGDYGSTGRVSEDFYVSSLSKPPSRKDSSVVKLCTVNWDRSMRLESLPRHRNCNGESYRSLNYHISMTCDGISIKFAVHYQGKQVAEHSLKVEYS